MTKVLYEPEEYHLRIEGHAGFASAGEDLVCAGISVLGWTLVARAEEDPDYMMHLFRDEQKAVLDVRCYPSEDRKDMCRELFDTIARGLSLLAEMFPEYAEMNHYMGEE